MIQMIKNKPPLTVFLLCIVCIVMTLFYFVYYIRTAELVPDSDKNYEWYDLLDHFNKEESCVSDHAAQEFNNVFRDSIPLVTVPTPLNIDVSKLSKYNKIYGILSLTDWVPRCPKERVYDKLKIRFDLPEDLKNFTGEICAQIIGPQDYLPLFLKQGCTVKNVEGINKKVGYLTAKVRTQIDDMFCHRGVPVMIHFNTVIDESNFSNYLSSVERNVIYIHLLWAGCLMLFLTICIIVYAFLYTEKQTEGYGEKCKNFLRK